VILVFAKFYRFLVKINFSDSTLPPSYKTEIKLKGKDRGSKPSLKVENPQASPSLIYTKSPTSPSREIFRFSYSVLSAYNNMLQDRKRLIAKCFRDSDTRGINACPDAK
jgi:hypothetical protein